MCRWSTPTWQKTTWIWKRLVSSGVDFTAPHSSTHSWIALLKIENRVSILLISSFLGGPKYSTWSITLGEILFIELLLSWKRWLQWGLFPSTPFLYDLFRFLAFHYSHPCERRWVSWTAYYTRPSNLFIMSRCSLINDCCAYDSSLLHETQTIFGKTSIHLVPLFSSMSSIFHRWKLVYWSSVFCVGV